MHPWCRHLESPRRWFLLDLTCQHCVTQFKVSTTPVCNLWWLTDDFRERKRTEACFLEWGLTFSQLSCARMRRGHTRAGGQPTMFCQGAGVRTA